LDGRVSNYDKYDTKTRLVDATIENGVAGDEIEGKKNIYRNGNQYLVGLTTEELEKLILNPHIRTVKQNIAFIVKEEDLPYLKISRDMQLKLEDDRSLVEEIKNDPSHHDRGTSIIEKKVLLPFSNKRPKIDEVEYEFAQIVCKFEKELDESKRNFFNITSGNQELSIEEVIWLATIFSKTEYDFTIEARKNLNSAKEIEPKNIGKNRFGNSSKQLCISSVKEIEHAASCRILSLDVKNGFCNEENIKRFRDYVLEVYSLEELEKQKEKAIIELQERIKRGSRFIEDSKEKVRVKEKEIEKRQLILQQISEFETKIQGKETSSNPCFPGNHDDFGEIDGH
jgi:hypothetical protein